MEEELRALKREEAERTKILMDLGSQRDRVALSIAQKMAKVGMGVVGASARVLEGAVLGGQVQLTCSQPFLARRIKSFQPTHIMRPLPTCTCMHVLGVPCRAPCP